MRFAKREQEAVVGIPPVVRMGIVGVQPQIVLIAIHVEDVRIAVSVGIMCRAPSVPPPLEILANDLGVESYSASKMR